MESVLGTATEENWYIISVYSGILTVALSASKKGEVYLSKESFHNRAY